MRLPVSVVDDELSALGQSLLRRDPHALNKQ
jgi:hypothetical protein